MKQTDRKSRRWCNAVRDWRSHRWCNCRLTFKSIITTFSCKQLSCRGIVKLCRVYLPESNFIFTIKNRKIEYTTLKGEGPLRLYIYHACSLRMASAWIIPPAHPFWTIFQFPSLEYAVRVHFYENGNAKGTILWKYDTPKNYKWLLPEQESCLFCSQIES